MIKRRKLGYMVLVIKVGVRSREWKNYPKKRKYHSPKNEKSTEVGASTPTSTSKTKVVVDISSDSEHSKPVEFGASTPTSTSKTKVVVVDISSDSEHSKPVEGYRLFDLNMLSKLVTYLLW